MYERRRVPRKHSHIHMNMLNPFLFINFDEFLSAVPLLSPSTHFNLHPLLYLQLQKDFKLIAIKYTRAFIARKFDGRECKSSAFISSSYVAEGPAIFLRIGGVGGPHFSLTPSSGIEQKQSGTQNTDSRATITL